MLRQRLKDALKTAMLEKDQKKVATMRLILAALKDRDIAARPEGFSDGVPDEKIIQLLQAMVKQRRESIVLYEKGARADLVAQEAGEIAIIEEFLPQQMGEAEIEAAISTIIAEIGAASVRDMGKVMAVLKERFSGGAMDFGVAGAIAKKTLGG